jgi:hypothetical protein
VHPVHLWLIHRFDAAREDVGAVARVGFADFVLANFVNKHLPAVAEQKTMRAGRKWHPPRRILRLHRMGAPRKILIVSPSSLPSNPPALPPRPLLFAVALVAASILLFEIALARVFGTVLRYHLSFLAISMALCGLGVGGFTVHWVRPRARIVLPTLGITFAVSIVAALLVLLRVVMARVPEEYWISALVVLVPFSLGGAWLAEAFARFPRHAGRVYAWDLGGAALAALVAVPVLNFLSAPAAVVAAAVLGGAGAVLSLLDYEGEAERFKSLQRARWIVPSALCLLLLLMGAPGGKGVQRLLDVPPLPPKPDEMGRTLNQRGITQDLFTELGTPNNKSRVVETRHNAFARTDVVDDPMSPGGFLLYTNGNVPTNMMRWDGRVSSLNTVAQDFRLSDWCFAAAALGRPKTSVFSIGPGGGLDALFALRHKAARFDGAEINPSILDIMSARAGMNGNIYNRANVRVEVADGRAFARRALARGQKYDLMFSALTKTATAGQGMALLESFIHTREAFGDYWALLKPRGQATLVLDNSPLLARFTATWLDVLQARGIGSREAMRHIAIVRDPMPGPYVFALVVQKSPFSRAESDALARAANARGLEAVWIPTQAALPIYGPYPGPRRRHDGSAGLHPFLERRIAAREHRAARRPEHRTGHLAALGRPPLRPRPLAARASRHGPPGALRGRAGRRPCGSWPAVARRDAPPGTCTRRRASTCAGRGSSGRGRRQGSGETRRAGRRAST